LGQVATHIFLEIRNKRLDTKRPDGQITTRP
jgi:hypothetical protein